MNFGKLGKAAIVAGAILGTVGVMGANAQSENYTKDRIGVMKAIGGAMQSGDVDVAKAKFVELAALWPAGSQGAYRAKAEIWNADGTLNADFAVILEAGANATSIDDLKNTCGACHQSFRGPKP